MTVNERAGIAEGMIKPTTEVFDAMRHALRLRIVDRLSVGGMATPGELAEEFGESQQNVSKHLKTLMQAGLVDRRQDGSSAFFTIRDDAVVQIVRDVTALARRTLVARSESAGLPSSGVGERRSVG